MKILFRWRAHLFFPVPRRSDDVAFTWVCGFVCQARSTTWCRQMTSAAPPRSCWWTPCTSEAAGRTSSDQKTPEPSPSPKMTAVRSRRWWCTSRESFTTVRTDSVVWFTVSICFPDFNIISPHTQLKSGILWMDGMCLNKRFLHGLLLIGQVESGWVFRVPQKGCSAPVTSISPAEQKRRTERDRKINVGQGKVGQTW